MTVFRRLRGLPKLKEPKPQKRTPEVFGKPKGVMLRVAKSINYERIKKEVFEAIDRLDIVKKNQIPAAGTLPEQMVALALVWLGYLFQCQSAESGGRLRLGGAVVDFVVHVGALPVIIRVMGSFWHKLPGREYKDLVQLERLRAAGYRVSDLWENDLYEAWVNGNLKETVDDAINSAV